MEIADLKARVESLERMVEKLTNPPPAVPREAVFCLASPPLPDTGDKGQFTRLVHCKYITRKWTKYLGYTHGWW